MQRALIAGLAVLLMALVASAGFAQDMSLTSDGKVPGQPFVTLQQQINALQAQVSQLQSRADDLQASDGTLQAQIDLLRRRIDKLESDLANIQLPPGPPGPQGPPGNLQLAGQTCPAGQAVSGFDALGNLLCADLSGGGSGADTLYDDFSSPMLDAGKWSIVASNGCTLVHSYLNNFLRSLIAFTGANEDCGVNFINPAAVARFSADVTVQDMTVSSGNVRARIAGLYFNAFVPSPTPGDLTGEVLAGINVHNFSPTGTVDWFIVVCNDPACGSTSSLGSGFLGTIELNQVRTLTLGWNGVTQFTFQLDDGAAQVYDVGFSNGVVVAGPSGTPARQIRGKGTGGAQGSLDVLFDNVHCETLTGQPCPHP
jgi:hypothetical protein